MKHEEFLEVGAGSIDWSKVLKAAARAGVQHYYVEQDYTPGDPIESLKKSYAYVTQGVVKRLARGCALALSSGENRHGQNADLWHRYSRKLQRR